MTPLATILRDMGFAAKPKEPPPKERKRIVLPQLREVEKAIEEGERRISPCKSADTSEVFNTRRVRRA